MAVVEVYFLSEEWSCCWALEVKEAIVSDKHAPHSDPTPSFLQTSVMELDVKLASSICFSVMALQIHIYITTSY